MVEVITPNNNIRDLKVPNTLADSRPHVACPSAIPHCPGGHACQAEEVQCRRLFAMVAFTLAARQAFSPLTLGRFPHRATVPAINASFTVFVTGRREQRLHWALYA